MEQAVEQGGIKPLGLVFLLIMGILIWRLPRRQAPIPLLISACYIPLGQMFIVLGLHLHVFRILLLVGCFRVLVKRENHGLRFTTFDRVFLWWGIVTLVVGTLTDVSLGRFINRSGDAYNALASYFLFRCWIRSLEDVYDSVRFASWMIVPLAISMLIEKSTGKNIFYLFGGLREMTEVREGRLRCQGAFEHPILAGTYGVVLFPLFAALWLRGGRDRIRSVVGVGSAAVITLASASSGAFLALLAAMVAIGLWFFRRRMRVFRWAMVLGIVVLHFSMKAPVWWAIAHVSKVVGGTGWHRSYLIDQAVKHFDEWWLVGSARTAHWAPYPGMVLMADPKNMDITDQYVAEGLRGGIWKLGLFIALIALGFKAVGRFAGNQAFALPDRVFVWGLGVSLSAHCVSFISISYFDQMVVMWYWLLAILSLISAMNGGAVSIQQAAARQGAFHRPSVAPAI